MHVTKEAVISSRIEGTQTNFEEALMPEVEIKGERKNDWNEVQNYTKALNDAINDLSTLPLSSRLIKKAHKILLSNVRGGHKQSGEYRKSQNWIGGRTLADAVFIPPTPHFVNPLMGDLENFLNNPDINIPALIRVGIAHYQFETIHPFLDGNGRIGRLLITLFLVSKNILTKPLLYLSAFFEKNKSLYYDNLTFVRTKNDMIQWLKYFLVGIAETSDEGVRTLQNILDLKQRIKKEIRTSWGRRSSNALILLNELFRNPIITVKDVKKICNLSHVAAGKLIDEFVTKKILIEFTKQTRNRIFIFYDYINIFNK